MDRHRSAPKISAEELLRSFVGGERGGKLRSQLVALHPDSSSVEIEEAIQAACDRFVDRADGISSPGQVYSWIRTTAHRLLNEEDDHHTREFAVDPTSHRLQELASEEPGPEEELITHENELELTSLVREVADSLPERERDVLALYGAGYKRPQIAARLGLHDSSVKRDLGDILDRARTAIARKAGGGCRRGEPLVLRFAYGLATPGECEQAHKHMAHCRRCEILCERLDAWRERVPALLPAPAVVEEASPGALGRLAHRATDHLAAVKEQVFGGASQLKQQAATTYYRAVDPTPLAGARPGTVAAVLVSCVTIGGGAATYCAQNSVDPLGAATGLIAGSGEEADPPPSSPSTEAPESTAVVPPAPQTESEQTEVSEPAPSSEPEPESEPAAEPLPPPPDPGNEPRSPNYPVSEEAESPTPESTPTESREPAPVSGGSGARQFGGP